MEAILVTMWQGIFRPDECVGTPKNKAFPRMDQVVFRGACGWVDATVIPFPIQMDLWYELIETV